MLLTRCWSLVANSCFLLVWNIFLLLDGIPLLFNISFLDYCWHLILLHWVLIVDLSVNRHTLGLFRQSTGVSVFLMCFPRLKSWRIRVQFNWLLLLRGLKYLLFLLILVCILSRINRIFVSDYWENVNFLFYLNCLIYCLLLYRRNRFFLCNFWAT